MHFMPKVSNTEISWLFLISVALSCKINLEHKVFAETILYKP